MLTAFRITSPRWVESALSGDGARLYGGRWNSPGKPAVYLAASRSLAMLEMLVHLSPSARAKTFVLLEVALDLVEADIDSPACHPDGWDLHPPRQPSQEFGDCWLEAGKKPLLRLPSALVPEEANYLLNPRHPIASKCQILSRRDFRFDQRL